MKELHWTVYVGCAVTTSAASALLIVSDVANVRDLGRWGLATALLAALIAAGIMCARFTKRICEVTHQEAAACVADVEQMLAQHTGKVVEAYDDRTEEIAESVCSAVVAVMKNRDSGATPIKR